MKPSGILPTLTGIVLLTVLLGGTARAEVPQEVPAPGQKLILLLDGPAPEAPAAALNLWRQGALFLLHLLPDSLNLGIITTADGGRVLLPGGRLNASHRQRAAAELSRALPSGKARPLLEMVRLILEGLGPNGPAEQALVVLTGGGGEEAPLPLAPAQEPEDLGARCRRQGLPVYGLVCGPQKGPEALGRLIAASGGRLWPARDEAAVPSVLVELYTFLYQPPQTPVGDKGFLLDPLVQAAVVAAPRAVAGQPVLLTDPGGGRLTPDSSTKTVTWLSHGTWDLVVLPQPRPGWWTVSRAQPGGVQVFLTTQLQLRSLWRYQEVGADEVLGAAGTLRWRGEPWTPPPGETVAFQGILTFPGQPPVAIPLSPPEGDEDPPCPSGTRVGRFPPPGREGPAVLRLQALGKTFQRELALPVTVGPPWYRLSTTASRDIHYVPAGRRTLRDLRGMVRWASAGGGLAGMGLVAPPGAELIIAPPPASPAETLVDIQLSGHEASGRPVHLAGQVVLPAQEVQRAPNPAPSSTPSRLSTRLARLLPPFLKTGYYRWLWLGLGLAGLGLVLGAAFLVYRTGLRRAESEDGLEGEAEGSASGKNLLLLKSQVETLQKEKAHLQSALTEAQQALEALQAEHASLAAELEKYAQRSRSDHHTLEELSKKLEEAESEAQSMKEEYMALYARTQGGKETLRKD
jgi:hypothetical protein